MSFTRQAQGPGPASLRPVDPAVALPPLTSVRLLDQLRERIRLLHYSLRTEEAYVCWARAFIRFHGLRHPAEMGKAEVEGFLLYQAELDSLKGPKSRPARPSVPGRELMSSLPTPSGRSARPRGVASGHRQY